MGIYYDSPEKYKIVSTLNYNDIECKDFEEVVLEYRKDIVHNKIFQYCSYYSTLDLDLELYQEKYKMNNEQKNQEKKYHWFVLPNIEFKKQSELYLEYLNQTLFYYEWQKLIEDELSIWIPMKYDLSIISIYESYFLYFIYYYKKGQGKRDHPDFYTNMEVYISNKFPELEWEKIKLYH